MLGQTLSQSPASYSSQFGTPSWQLAAGSAGPSTGSTSTASTATANGAASTESTNTTQAAVPMSSSDINALFGTSVDYGAGPSDPLAYLGSPVFSAPASTGTGVTVAPAASTTTAPAPTTAATATTGLSSLLQNKTLLIGAAIVAVLMLRKK